MTLGGEWGRGAGLTEKSPKLKLVVIHMTSNLLVSAVFHPEASAVNDTGPNTEPCGTPL